MKKSIGIVGGMGPLATADLFRKIVLSTRAEGDSGHIRVFMDCNPTIPDRTAAILQGGESPVPQLLEAVSSVVACGADVLVMPCNTAHYFLPQLKAATDRPFISMPRATARACAARFPGAQAALLSTTGTYAAGVYDAPLRQAGVAYITPLPHQREALMRLIYAVKAGTDTLHMKSEIAGILDALRAQGADYFILGCTELPMAVAALSLEGPFVDPTQELAEAAIRWCGYQVADSQK